MLAGFFLSVLAAALLASSLGSYRAERQSAFDVTGDGDEWVILRRAGDQLLAARRDTTGRETLRLTGEYAVLKATPDSEPVVVRRRVLRQDSLTIVDVPGTAQAADPALVVERLRERVLVILWKGDQGGQPARALADWSVADCPGTRGTTARHSALADSLARLIGVERRRTSDWRLTYQVRRGALRGDSLRVAVRNAPTLLIAVCRGDALLTSWWPPATDAAATGVHGSARTARPRPR